MHKVCDPQVVYIFYLIGLSDVCAGLDCQPALFFDYPKKGIVVNGGLAQKILSF
ncbi:MAG: hypothetical protein JRI65_14490 [Deltaproteobacteria bacterium]|nr:hypothetical protein [Deltaproteobacteria bacterium]